MRVVILIGFIFGFALGLVDGIASDLNAPFLYYYSYPDKGVVIERADGTKRRILGEGLAQETVYNLRWSPSGQWLAWGETSNAINGPFLEYYEVNAWVSSYDGQENISLDTWGEGNNWRWSPTEDWLIVSNSATDGPNSGFVVDIPTREVFYTFDQDVNVPSWTADGRHLRFVERREVQLEDGTTVMNTVLVTISRDGQRQEREITYSAYSNVLQPSPDGRLYYLHPTRRTLIAEDIYNNEIYEYPEPLFPIRGVFWSPDGQKVLIYTETSMEIAWDHQQYHLWLLAGRTLQQISTDAILPRDGTTSESAFKPYENWILWTPDSERASFATTDSQAYWVWVDSLRMQKINLPSVYGAGRRYGLPQRAQWYPDGRSGLVRLGDDIWEYDLETDSFGASRIELHPSVAISASGRFWAVIDRCVVDDVVNHYGWTVNPYRNCLIDLKNDRRVEVPSQKNSPTIESNLGGSVNWHPSEDWVILEESASITYPYLGYSVVHGTGRLYRPLRTISPWISTIEWLPENVPID